MRAVAIASGGMDSTTLLYLYKVLNWDVDVLSFDYGQKHRKELEYCRNTCVRLGFSHHVIDLASACNVLDSALTRTNRDVPEGHYTEDTMSQTVVPNRNAIMLNIAIGAAISAKAQMVGAAMHAGDHVIYPDCRPEFIEQMEQSAHIANKGFISTKFFIHTPFIHMTKADIAKLGEQLFIPWHETWSCYKGGDTHCGRCATCVERLEALYYAGAGPTDKTEYEDTEYWHEMSSV